MNDKSNLRDLIARAAYGAVEEYYAQPNDGMQKSEHDFVADAVLAVLADLPDDVIEQAARALDPEAWDEAQWLTAGRPGALPTGPGAVAARNDARFVARTVLTAVFGDDR